MTRHHAFSVNQNDIPDLTLSQSPSHNVFLKKLINLCLEKKNYLFLKSGNNYKLITGDDDIVNNIFSWHSGGVLNNGELLRSLWHSGGVLNNGVLLRSLTKSMLLPDTAISLIEERAKALLLENNFLAYFFSRCALDSFSANSFFFVAYKYYNLYIYLRVVKKDHNVSCLSYDYPKAIKFETNHSIFYVSGDQEALEDIKKTQAVFDILTG